MLGAEVKVLGIMGGVGVAGVGLVLFGLTALGVVGWS